MGRGGMQSCPVVLLLRGLSKINLVKVGTAARPMDSLPVITGNVSAKISCVMAPKTARGVKMRNLAPVLEYSGVTISLVYKLKAVVTRVLSL